MKKTDNEWSGWMRAKKLLLDIHPCITEERIQLKNPQTSEVCNMKRTHSQSGAKRGAGERQTIQAFEWYSVKQTIL